jgi:AcrR family transcriptional regulator
MAFPDCGTVVLNAMAYNSADTRRRLLDAAIEEFSRHGLAGARVEAIAGNAKANKRAIYEYYGSKDALFVAAFEDRIADWRAAIHFDEYDLPESAGRMFDRYAETPQTWRLMFWASIEQAGTRPILPALAQMYGEYAARIAAAQAAGRVTQRYSPPMILGIIRALVLTWQVQAVELGANMSEGPETRRAIIVEAIRTLLDDSSRS